MDYSLKFYQGANLFESVPLRDGPMAGHGGGGPRGNVLEFSAASRLRLIRRLASVKESTKEHGLWLDLTYPNNERDGRKAARDLRVFLKRLKRAFPGVCGIWKRELQERGAIHFHLMVWGVDFIPWAWVAENWYEIVGSGNPDHLAAGTSVHHVHSAKQAAAYASKYQAKEVLAGEGIEGRWWGMFGDWEKEVAEVVEWVVDRVGISRVWRVLDTWRLAQSRRVRDLEKRSAKIGRARRRRDTRLVVGGFFLGEIDCILPKVARLITQG